MIPTRRGHRGFTLIELMIAVVVAGILAAVAYPSFTSFLQRSRRSDAMAVLTTLVQAQERYRSNHSTYAADTSTLNIDVSKIAKYYTVGFTDLGDTPAYSTGYILTASAIGPQVGDAYCAKLSIKLQGALFSYLSAKADGTDTTNDPSNPRCWAR
jgi:type IV pilus assembly protein PilE